MQIATPFNALQLWQRPHQHYGSFDLHYPHILRLYADCNPLSSATIYSLQASHLTPVRRLQPRVPLMMVRRCPHILRLYADCNSKDAQNYKMPARILCAGFQTVHTQFTLPRVSTTFRGKNYAYCLDSRTMSCPDLVRTSQLFCGSFRFALHF